MLPVQSGELRGGVIDQQNYSGVALFLVLREHSLGTGGKAGGVGQCAVIGLVKSRRGGAKSGWAQSILFCSRNQVMRRQIVRYWWCRGLIGLSVYLFGQGIQIIRGQRTRVIDDDQNISNQGDPLFIRGSVNGRGARC